MKYKLLPDVSRSYKGVTLYRIIALKNIGRRVKAGTLGGWLQSYSNLEQSGDCWVRGTSKVFGNARICDNALVADGTIVSGDVVVKGNSKLHWSNFSGDEVINHDGNVIGNANFCPIKHHNHAVSGRHAYICPELNHIQQDEEVNHVS